MDLTGQAFKSVFVRLLTGIAIANSKLLAALLRMVELWVFVFFFRVKEGVLLVAGGLGIEPNTAVF